MAVRIRDAFDEKVRTPLRRIASGISSRASTSKKYLPNFKPVSNSALEGLEVTAAPTSYHHRQQSI